MSYIGYKTLIDTINSQESKTYILEPTEVSLNQVVVTAQYSESDPEKAVHKIRIIDRKKIEAMGAVNLTDVLRNENNIRISQDNILGSSMGLQGISGQNVKVLIDGVPVIGRLDGNIDLSQINLNNIERIEIVEGPLSVNYGTDALAGTINLITKKDQKKKFEVGLNSYYESAGQYNLDGRVGMKLGKGQLSLSGGRNFFDGWSPEDEFFKFPESRLADTNRTDFWNPKEQYFAKLQYALSGESQDGLVHGFTVRPYAEYFSEEVINKGMPREPYYENAFDDYYYTWRKNAGADFSARLKGNKKVSILAAFNQYKRIKNTYLKDLTTLEQDLTANSADQDTSFFNLWMSRGTFSTTSDSTTINFQAGYDISYETASGQRIQGGERTQGDYAIFGSVEWTPIQDLLIRPGMRYSYNTRYDAPVVPSLNTRWKKGDFTVRLSYARGFRAPSLKELYFEFVDVNHNIQGNKDLEAELSDNYQLNITWQKLKAQSIIKLEAGGYFNQIDNLITLVQTPETTEYAHINVGEHQTIGLQTNGELMFEHIKLNGGFAYVGRYNQLTESSGTERFAFSPEVRGNFYYDLHSWDANFSIFYKYTGKLPGFRQTTEGEIYQTEVDDYHTVDMSFTKRFFNRKIQWTVGAKNLLDVRNINSSSTSGGAHSGGGGSVPVSWGRTVFTKLSLNF